jgi:UDP-N-acetylglucosamine:LPS N-acetylglucosamine transferase
MSINLISRQSATSIIPIEEIANLDFTTALSRDVNTLISDIQKVTSKNDAEITSLKLRADTVFQKAIEVLNKAPGSRQNAQHVKILETAVKAFRELDNAFSKFSGKPLHRYCCCHVLEENASKNNPGLKSEISFLEDDTPSHYIPYPQKINDSDPLNGKSALVYSWSLGGGHDVVQASIGKALSEQGSHVYNIAIDNELKHLDIISKITCQKYTISNFINYLLRNNWSNTLNFIDKLFGGPESEADRQKKINSMINILKSRGNPDVSLACLLRLEVAMAKASYSQNIPFVLVAPDLDVPLIGASDEDVEFLNQYEKYRHGTMVNDAHLNSRIQVSPEKVSITGIPVRPSFLVKRSNVEIDQLREKWGIQPNKRLVVVMSGGNGGAKTIPEIVHNNYPLEEKAPEIALFVVCGNNPNLKTKLDTLFEGNQNRKALGWTSEEDLGELYSIIADERTRGAVLSTKGGGGTVSEIVAAGVPALVNTNLLISWEIENVNFLIRNKLALGFSNVNEITPKLAELLNWDKFEAPLAKQNEGGKIVDVVKGLLN